MEKLSGAQMVVRALEDEGVEFVFGYPGGAVIDIYDALYSAKKLKHVLVRHEQAAVHAADGYARCTGRVGVALATSGPGATNCVTGIATAYMDSVPMVIITGQVGRPLIGSDAFQEVDTVGITRPIVKHSFLCTSAEELPVTIKKAFYLASTGRPGPVLIDIPKNVQNPKNLFDYEYPKEISMRSYNPTLHGHKGQIKRAVKLLADAKRPVLYAGGGIVLANASQAVRDLAEKFNMPVVSSLMGLGVLPGSDRKFLGMLGMHGTYEANMAMHNSDLVLAVGTRFSLLLGVGISIINFVIGLIWGAVSGYYGGTTDLIMERITDIISCVPTIVILNIASVQFTNNADLKTSIGQGGIIILAFLLAFVYSGWVGVAGTTRMQFYRFKGQEYVLASRTLGAKDPRLIFRHILPNAAGTLVTSSVLMIPGVIFGESTLSYLGVVNFTTSGLVSIGSLLNEGSRATLNTYPHMLFFPCLVISMLMICFNLFGNGLRDAFNTTLRGSED